MKLESFFAIARNSAEQKSKYKGCFYKNPLDLWLNLGEDVADAAHGFNAFAAVPGRA